MVEERFDDEGRSGTTLDRPALHRLLTVVRSGGIEKLVIHRLDRLSGIAASTSSPGELRITAITVESSRRRTSQPPSTDSC